MDPIRKIPKKFTKNFGNKVINPIPCGGGPHGPPLGVISCHSVGDAPTNPKFLDFSQFDPYFHLVKSFFTFFCNFYEKNAVKFFFRHKKE